MDSRPNDFSARLAARTLLALVVSLAAAFALMTPASASASSPGGTLGVYRGGGDVNGANAFGSWLGRRTTYALDFFAFNTWADIESPTWALNQWGGKGYTVVYTAAMLPLQGGATLAQGATGAYNSHWTKLAQTLVARGAGNAIIRLGWEFNGDWYAWSIKNGTANYASYFRHVVTSMRAVAPGLRFDWTASCGSSTVNGRLLDPAAAYPGDEYVDYIGMDIYDQAWITNRSSASARFTALRDQQYGLTWHKNFAAAHGKPMTFPEWGLVSGGSGYGGGDAPEFIQSMHDWISANNVAYHMYFEFDAPDGNHALMYGQFPNAAARFRQLFMPAGPGSSPTPADPTPSPSPSQPRSPEVTPPARTPAPATPAPVSPAPSTGSGSSSGSRSSSGGSTGSSGSSTRTTAPVRTPAPVVTQRSSSASRRSASRSASRTSGKRSSSLRLRAARVRTRAGASAVRLTWHGAGSNVKLFRNGKRLTVRQLRHQAYLDRHAADRRTVTYTVCSTQSGTCSVAARVAAVS